jgi:para-aminobenzoate synthetase/4-amino-4-deoxychorismate lyase
MGRLPGWDEQEWVAVREPLTCGLSPADAALALRGEERPFALIGAWAGGGALLGSQPVRVVEDADAILRALDAQPHVRAGEDGLVGGGWFGYLGFGLSQLIERLDPAPALEPSLPAGSLAFYDHVVRLASDGRWWFEALVTPEREAALEARRALLQARLASPPARRPFDTSDWRWTPSPAGHARVVDACRDRICRGDLFQANLCQRLDGRLEGDPLDLFASAVSALPTDRAAYMSGPWGAIASLSPELFLERHGRRVRTAPIKGTRPLDDREALVRSEKDRAENVMIVDLMRNDLGRVCVAGSVSVPAVAEARRHAGVWHLVSEVEGELREGVSDAALLHATFPPGSVTGAPKIAALNVISELESARREAYTGAIGFSSPLHGLELSVAIRTFEVQAPRIWLGVGGGVVADSHGAGEADEAAAKVAPLLSAIGATPPPAGAPGRSPVPDHVRRGPRPVPRPDRAAGIYETLRVRGGVAERWAEHLARLAASARRLYGLDLPEDLPARAHALAAGRPDGRLRIDVVPGADVALRITPMPEPAEAVLRPVLLPGGLGAHKWRDRALLEAHEAEDPATLPLLVDVDGRVLETSRTGLAVEAEDGTLWTPPHDGRILPSVTVRSSRARPRALTLDDLHGAAAIYVASALRGLQPARLGLRGSGSEASREAAIRL